jgi:hypothetical protein
MYQTTQNGAISAPKKELLRGTTIAAIVAGIILTVAILPAEYGIDPTGMGKLLGLTSMHNAAAATTASVPIQATPATVTQPVTTTTTIGSPARKPSTVAAPGEERAITIASAQTAPYRADTMEITLPPGKGLEVKTHLAKGAT